MAFAYLNSFLSINADDISDTIKSAQLTFDSVAVDANTMGTEWAQTVGGVKSATLDIEVQDDFAVGEIDSKLWALFGNASVAFVWRADQGAISTSNPSYSGNIHVGSHQVGGSHGDGATKTLSFAVNGPVTRATS